MKYLVTVLTKTESCFFSVFLLGGYRSTILKIMRQARAVGLTQKGYAFICYELLIDTCAGPPSTVTNKDDCDLLEGLLDISLFVPQNEEYQKFATLVRQKMAEAPFNRQMSDDESVSEAFSLFNGSNLKHNSSLNSRSSLYTNLVLAVDFYDERKAFLSPTNFVF